MSRSGSSLVCLALLAAGCSVDARTLRLSGSSASAGFGGETNEDDSDPDSETNVAGAASEGAHGDGESGAPSTSPRCSGTTGEVRCEVSGGQFELGPEAARVPASVSAFQLDELEVTVARFRKYVTSFGGPPAVGAGAHPSLAGSGWRTDWSALLPADREHLLQSLHCNADWQTWTDEPGEREGYPLTCASYYVAFAFCAWSSGRLPTEAEWEYAARGGAQQRAYPWGDADPTRELALFGASAIAPAGGHRSGVARFGQLDLAGSAWEWTLDLYRDYAVRCDDCAELERGFERVLRGGAFVYDAEYLRAGYRYHLDPQLALGDVGFRCAYAAE